jgi:hypothetical protein
MKNNQELFKPWGRTKPCGDFRGKEIFEPIKDCVDLRGN